MNLQPTIENDLVILRPLEPSDFEALYKVAKDPKIWEQHHVKRYLEDIFKDFFDDAIKHKGTLVILDKKTKSIIGSSRFKPIDVNPKVIEIGWTFMARDFWGGMYNAAVKKSMIEHAFKYVDHVVFMVNKINLRSQKAVYKIGGRKLNASEFTELSNLNPDNYVFIIEKHRWFN